MFGEAFKTFITFLAAVEAIVGLPREKAPLHASSFVYYRVRSERLLRKRQKSSKSR
jgi:hypothetical protein